MWIPQTEQEITNAVTSNSLEETITFDAKREISKNIDVAKDVSAMANTAGGVIIYGIDEDEHGRPTILSPIDLEGQREKVDSVIRTSISEVPYIKITAIETQADKSKGYLVVIIPPSERAPHMVIVKGDRRYYGRGETGNYVLSEPEVTRLYERRSLTQASILPTLEKAISESPMKDYEGFAHLHLIAKPVIQDDLLNKALATEQSHYQLLNNLVREVMESNVYPRSYNPDFVLQNWIRKPEGYLNKMWKYVEGNYKTPSLYLQVNFDGSGSLFCSRAAESKNHELNAIKWFMPQVIAGNTTKFLALLGNLYDKASYFGMVDIAVAVTELQGSMSYNAQESMYVEVLPFEDSDYRRTARISASLLKENPRQIAADLVMPLIDAVSQGIDKPFTINK